MPADRSALVLAIDLGTSSIRTALFDQNGRRLRGTLTQREHTVSHSADGAAELDPARVERNLLACLRGTLTHTGRRPVQAVGMSCFWHSLLGTDAAGRPLTPIYTWADSRSREDAAQLRSELSEKDYHAQTGCMLRSSFWPAKLRWLARTQPALLRRIKRWESPADWLYRRLCGNAGATTAIAMATGTGLFSPLTLDWVDSLLSRCEISRDQLAPIADQPARLKTGFARRFPALANAEWWPAIGDGAAGNLGSGATQAGRAAINIGTSAAFRVMRSGLHPSAPFGLFCYRVDAERYLIGGAISNAGNLRAWCKRELRLPDDDRALDRALAKRPGPLSSIVTLPFWTAERAPTWCENLGGILQGISQDTTALDLLQATTEGTYHRLALIADLALAHGARKKGPPTRIIVSGGVLKSRGLLQRLASVLGRDVHPSRESEASLRGAAVYALEKMGGNPAQFSRLPSLVGPSIHPQKNIAAAYARERSRQQQLETTLT